MIDGGFNFVDIVDGAASGFVGKKIGATISIKFQSANGT